MESGPVRLFGITAEKAGPGVVYDSLGLNGASITVLTRMFNQDHWAEELRHRNPDLVVINYGTNEADFAAFVDKQYEKELREAIRRVRAAARGFDPGDESDGPRPSQPAARSKPCRPFRGSSRSNGVSRGRRAAASLTRSRRWAAGNHGALVHRTAAAWSRPI